MLENSMTSVVPSPVLTADQSAVTQSLDQSPRRWLESLAEVKLEALEWVWGRVIPRGKLTMIVGPSGVGKSALMLDVAAGITRGERGPLDLCPGPPGEVVLYSQDDGLADTIQPRLEATRADLARVYTFHGGNEQRLATAPSVRGTCELERDLPSLEAEVWRLRGEGVDLRMLVIDKLGGLERHPDPSPLVSRLSQLASRARIAIVMLADVSEWSASKCGFDQIAANGRELIASAARSIWVIARDLNLRQRRLLLPIKTNLCEEPPGHGFSIGQASLEWESEPIAKRGDDFVKCVAERRKKIEELDNGSELSRATEWLSRRLSRGMVRSTFVQDEAKENGISHATLRRAFHRLNCVARKHQDSGHWYWTMRRPEETRPDNPSNRQDEDGVNAEDHSFGRRRVRAVCLADLIEAGSGEPRTTMPERT